MQHEMINLRSLAASLECDVVQYKHVIRLGECAPQEEGHLFLCLISRASHGIRRPCGIFFFYNHCLLAVGKLLVGEFTLPNLRVWLIQASHN